MAGEYRHIMDVLKNEEFHSRINKEKKFDYQQEALRTESYDFFPKLINEGHFKNVMLSSKEVGERIDDIKKALFYGKKTERIYGLKTDTEPEVYSRPEELHAVLGIMSEASELYEAFEKNDTKNMKEEIGDLFWFISFLCSVNGWTFEEVQKANIEKLKRRYPEKFSCELAIKRLDKLDENI